MERATRALSGLLLGLAGLTVGAIPTIPQATAQNPQSTYRSGVLVVPIDVRVIDRKTGQPVTDLAQDDFTIFEDDVRQEIRHFARQSFGTPEGGEAPTGPAGSGSGGKPAARLSPLSIAPQTRRVFLIVLSRGRLQGGPAKALDAAAHFVREHLLPRDQVAVFGYDRATDFTADHEQAAAVIDRFRVDNDVIAGTLAQLQGGLAAVYGSRDLPASVQERIDRIFEGTGSLPYSPLGSARTDRTGDRARQDTRRQFENAADAVIAARRLAAEQEAAPVATGAAPGIEWSTFDAFASRNMQTLDDTKNLYAAIAYMQRLDGEKHLIFLTPGGLNFQRIEDYEDISRRAADARVALDVVQSGFGNVLQMTAMRSLSEDTGGVASIAEYGQAALDRVDRVTRTEYVLGYYPSNTRLTGDYRRIRVTVRRPDITVVYRRGYRASDAIPEFDRRAYLTQFRMEAAARRASDTKDIGVKIHASVTAAKGQFEATVEAVIDVSRLSFGMQDDLHVGRLEVAIVAMDDAGRGLAAQSRTLAPVYADEDFAHIRKDGLRCTMRMPVPSGTRYVRFIVYDYDADLVGTAGSKVF